MLLQASNIKKSYGNKFNRTEVLKGIDLSLGKGGVCLHYGGIRIR